ncbi:MAG: ketoacyl-ACP synthase III [Acidobacteriota bacterium]
MPAIAAFGRYAPERRLKNDQLARILGCEPGWILQASGIEERRVADEAETVVDMGAAAGRDCLAKGAGKPALLIVSSATGDNRFPGPAAEIALRLGLAGIPAIDLPVASAGALFGMATAAAMTGAFGDVLVIAAEKMSIPARAEPLDRNTAILFGDGAGACLITREGPGLQIVDAALHSDGTWCGDLRLGLSGPVRMNGLTVILQAARKLPSAIGEVLQRNGVKADTVGAFLMHQANQNLIDRVARALDVPPERFYSNIRHYGNTSSASMLIAASDWRQTAALQDGEPVCFAAFGAGFHWGALLARQRT